MKKIYAILAFSLITNAQAAIDFNNYSFTPYGTGQDQSGNVSVSADGQSLTITGNAWKKIDYPYVITKQTMLSFELSDATGEAIGIGLDSDNVISMDKLFKLAGTDPINAATTIGNSYAQKNGDTIAYEIPIGRLSLGQYQNIFFVCDDDATASCNATFKDVRLSEKKVTLDNTGHLVMGNSQKLDTYGWLQDLEHTIETTSNSIDIVGNTWRALPIESYSLTANTMLEFEFDSNNEGEIHGIGLDNNLNNIDAQKTFRVYGTQTWGIDATSYAQGATANGTLYQIPIGQHIPYNYDVNYIFFANDKDNGAPDAHSHYTNIRIYESN